MIQYNDSQTGKQSRILKLLHSKLFGVQIHHEGIL